MSNSLFQELSAAILKVQKQAPVLVAVDGVDGSGKTHFAHQLRASLEKAGKTVVVVGIDGFHHPRAIRYRLGANSPLGYYSDSYDYDAFIEKVIKPFQNGGLYYTSIFDVDSDCKSEAKPMVVPLASVLIVEGIFLHRTQLLSFWDYSIFLDVSEKTHLQRNIDRDPRKNDPKHLEQLIARFNERYKPGQNIYLSENTPQSHADVVVCNDDFTAPFILSR
ncbi:MAG: uridine kinase [Bacteroidetes bacterium]|nr:uridine kinase [Bacteroidota bacterium]